MFEDRTPLRLAELLEQKIGGFQAPKLVSAPSPRRARRRGRTW
jgi:amidase